VVTRFSAPVQTGPGAHPASCTMGTGSFPGVKSGRRVTLTPHSLIVPQSRKSRAIPVLPLWTVRPVQSLGACTRVHFTCMIRNPWVLPWGDSCIGRVTCFTGIGVSSLVDSRVFSGPHCPIHKAYSTYLPEDEPTKFESCRINQKLNINL